MLANKKSVATTKSTTEKHTNLKYKVPQILKNCK